MKRHNNAAELSISVRQSPIVFLFFLFVCIGVISGCSADENQPISAEQNRQEHQVNASSVPITSSIDASISGADVVNGSYHAENLFGEGYYVSNNPYDEYIELTLYSDIDDGPAFSDYSLFIDVPIDSSGRLTMTLTNEDDNINFQLPDSNLIVAPTYTAEFTIQVIEPNVSGSFEINFETADGNSGVFSGNFIDAPLENPQSFVLLSEYNQTYRMNSINTTLNLEGVDIEASPLNVDYVPSLESDETYTMRINSRPLSFADRPDPSISLILFFNLGATSGNYPFKLCESDIEVACLQSAQVMIGEVGTPEFITYTIDFMGDGGDIRLDSIAPLTGQASIPLVVSGSDVSVMLTLTFDGVTLNPLPELSVDEF
ncbi:MAG: hypothetical protein AAF846_23415 [Chloroflexota bacterium]